MDDNSSVGASTVASNMSEVLMRAFPWLYQNHQNNVTILEDNEAHVLKQNEILACLNGQTEEEEVDLWHLRLLCVHTDGLLSSHLRKRAWPKLMGAHTLVLLHAASSDSKRQETVSRSDLALLQRDVSRSVWHVEDEVMTSRRKTPKSPSKKVSFLPVPGLMAVTPREEDENEEHAENPQSPTKSVSMETGLLTPLSDIGSEGMISPSDRSTMSVDTIDTITPKRQSSEHEQRVLFNLIMNVLRMPMEDSPYYEDDRLHYFRGLHDLAALMLINLESPSLTSLVLGKVCSYQLRDAMRNNNIPLKTTLRFTVFPLLNLVDPKLHARIRKCMDIPAFALNWVQCWFSQQITNVRVASRLVDFFLASHAMMPIYFCVAFLVHPANRSKLMAPIDRKEMRTLLRSLPVEMMKETFNKGQELSERVEWMIDQALTWMEQTPPSALLQMQLPNKELETAMPSITMMQDVPEWVRQPSAPTDWALLQKAKVLRMGGTVETELGRVRKTKVSTVSRYPKAAVAVGVKVETERKPQSKRVVILLMLILSFFLTRWTYGRYVQRSSTVLTTPEEVEGRKRRKRKNKAASSKSAPATKKKVEPFKPIISPGSRYRPGASVKTKKPSSTPPPALVTDGPIITPGSRMRPGAPVKGRPKPPRPEGPFRPTLEILGLEFAPSNRPAPTPAKVPESQPAKKPTPKPPPVLVTEGPIISPGSRYRPGASVKGRPKPPKKEGPFRPTLEILGLEWKPSSPSTESDETPSSTKRSQPPSSSTKKRGNEMHPITLENDSGNKKTMMGYNPLKKIKNLFRKREEEIAVIQQPPKKKNWLQKIIAASKNETIVDEADANPKKVLGLFGRGR